MYLISRLAGFSLLALVLFHASGITARISAGGRRAIEGIQNLAVKEQSPAAPATSPSAKLSLLSDAEARLAAEANAKSKLELAWEFGAKQQRGWAIYAPLVCQTIGADALAADVSTLSFADALARWQKAQTLPATGVMDDTTLYRFIAVWQAARLKVHETAPENKLVMVGADEWFDPTRDADLRRVHNEAYAAYKKMIAAALADKSLGLASVKTKTGATEFTNLAPTEQRMKLVSAFRPQAYQDKLRAQSPHSGRGALAKVSAHLTGCALDIYIAGDPVSTDNYNRLLQVNTPLYRWLVRNAARFGFVPYFYEPWHWEYVGGASSNDAAQTTPAQTPASPSAKTNQ